MQDSGSLEIGDAGSNGDESEMELPIHRPKQNVNVKLKKAPGAPRRFKSAYIFFSSFKHRELRDAMGANESSKARTTSVAKLVSDAWRDLSPEDRAPFDEMARKDKARYQIESSMYTGPWKVSATKIRDPEAPKRPCSAFVSFSNDMRYIVKRKHPNSSSTDIMRIMASMWKTHPTRQAYVDRELAGRIEYKTAMAKWKAKKDEPILEARQMREEIALQTLKVQEALFLRPSPREDDKGVLHRPFWAPERSDRGSSNEASSMPSFSRPDQQPPIGNILTSNTSNRSVGFSQMIRDDEMAINMWKGQGEQFLKPVPQQEPDDQGMFNHSFLTNASTTAQDRIRTSLHTEEAKMPSSNQLRAMSALGFPPQPLSHLGQHESFNYNRSGHDVDKDGGRGMAVQVNRTNKAHIPERTIFHDERHGGPLSNYAHYAFMLGNNNDHDRRITQGPTVSVSSSTVERAALAAPLQPLLMACQRQGLDTPHPDNGTMEALTTSRGSNIQTVDSLIDQYHAQQYQGLQHQQQELRLQELHQQQVNLLFQLEALVEKTQSRTNAGDDFTFPT